MKTWNMRIHFGFVSVQNVEKSEEACKTIVKLMQEFLEQAQRFNQESYGFSGAPIKCNIYSSDIFSSEEIHRIAREIGGTTNMIASSYQPDLSEIQADAVIGLDMKKHNLSYPNTVAEYVVNKSDAVFLLWDGKQNFQEGILWAAMQFCKQKRIPYYLINTEKLEEVSFSSDSYYVPYGIENVTSYVKKLYDHKEKEQVNDPVPLMKLWVRMHDRFIRKYKLKAPTVPYVEDKLLSASYFSDGDARAHNHAMLAEYFEYYDKKAIEASSLYRASIYFRSILPMLTTIFIAVGFYAETVLTFILGKPLLFGMNFWVIAAGIGFLIHALLNRYASKIAENPRVERLQKDFVEARFIAEYLRIAIHSETYGIQIGNAWMENSLVDPDVLARLHHIVRQQESVSLVQKAETTKEAIASFEALIADQKAYHENCINRYALIAQRLQKMAATLYMAGFVIVVSRGFLQFLIPFISSSMNLSKEIHAVKIDSFMKSFANMLALVMPAWASYYSTKLNMNGYEWLLKNSQKMKAGFEAAQTKLDDIKLQKNSYQIISDVAKDIMDLTQEDYTGWYQRMGSQKFTRL